MKTMMLAFAATLAIPVAAFAQATPPESECCCKKHEQAGQGCCPEAAPDDDHAGHPAPAPAGGPR